MARLKWLWQYANDEGGSPTGRGKLFTNRKPDNNGFYRVKDIKDKVDGARLMPCFPRAQVSPETWIPSQERHT